MIGLVHSLSSTIIVRTSEPGYGHLDMVSVFMDLFLSLLCDTSGNVEEALDVVFQSDDEYQVSHKGKRWGGSRVLQDDSMSFLTGLQADVRK